MSLLHLFQITSHIVSQSNETAIRDFLQEHYCIVNVESSIGTIDGDTVYVVMKNGSSGRYNVSIIQVTQRTLVPPNHRANIIVELTNPTHIT